MGRFKHIYIIFVLLLFITHSVCSSEIVKPSDDTFHYIVQENDSVFSDETKTEETFIDKFNGQPSLSSEVNIENVPIVTFERIADNRANSRGEEIMLFYYDKPVFSESIASHLWLNSYFTNEAYAFFWGSYVSKHFSYSYHEYFYGTEEEDSYGAAKDFIESFGGIDDFTIGEELYCTITSEIFIRMMI